MGTVGGSFSGCGTITLAVTSWLYTSLERREGGREGGRKEEGKGGSRGER